MILSSNCVITLILFCETMLEVKKVLPMAASVMSNQMQSEQSNSNDVLWAVCKASEAQPS